MHNTEIRLLELLVVAISIFFSRACHFKQSDLQNLSLTMVCSTSGVLTSAIADTKIGNLYVEACRGKLTTTHVD
jgi:hypothetical protein